jgi:hypothetical protein
MNRPPKHSLGMNEWTSSVCAVVGTKKAASDAMAMFRFDLTKT